MSGYYFDQYALNILAQLIMTLAITGYLLALKNKSRPTLLLTLVFISIALNAAFSLVNATAPWTPDYYFSHLQVVAGSLIVVTLLQFAYHFPVPLKNRLLPREPLAALIVSLLATAGALGWAIYHFLQLRPGGSPTTNTTPTNLWLLLGFLWTVTVFLRQSYNLSRDKAPDESGLSLLFRPRGRLAVAAFNFGIVPLLGAVLMVILNFADGLDIIPGSVGDLAASALVLIAVSLIGLFYFNYAPERISFMARLVTISLVTVLLILGMISFVIAPSFKALYLSSLPDAYSQTLHFERGEGGSYSLTSLPLQMIADWGEEQSGNAFYDLPFTFPFFEQQWQTVNIRDSGFIIQGEWFPNAYQYNMTPAVTPGRFPSDAKGSIFIHSAADRYVVTWLQSQDSDAVTQAVLYPDGTIDIHLQNVRGRFMRRIGLQSGTGGAEFTAFDFNRMYVQTPLTANGLLADFDSQQHMYIHDNLWPLAYIELLAALFLIIVFPYFFRVILIRPLNRLVEGVQAVDDGNLQTVVPVQAQDEIGLITESFNRMVASVYANDQNLETQVRNRTNELAVSEARYRKLFETMNSAVMVFSVAENGRFFLRDYNRTGERAGRINWETALGKSLEELFADSEAESLEQLLEQVYQAEPFKQFPPILLNRDGRHWREVTAYKLSADEMVMVLDDVTDRLANEARQQHMAILEERERIGRELHDDLGQVLGFVNVQSQAALALLEKDDTRQARAALRQLADVTQDAHDDVREYILGIRSEDDPQTGSFFDLLHRYLDSLRSNYGLDVQVSLPELWRNRSENRPKLFAPAVETQLLRIIQEGLTNIHKHAGVKTANLFFTQLDDTVQILIGDSGTGFSLGRVQSAKAGHFGLSIMQERAEKAGGALEIRSAPGSGTQLIVQLPLASNQEDFSLVGVKVLLVDDHQLYIEGLRNLLSTKNMIVVGTAANGQEAVKAALDLRPDLILMDVEMPNGNGLEATREIKKKLPESLIVMLTMAADSETLFQAMKYGASGYLLKSLEGDDFFALLANVLNGETVLSPTIAAHILDDVLQAEEPPEPDVSDKDRPVLTSRQIEVLKLIVQGMTNQEIGQALHISENTVKYHVRQILAVFQLQSRYELAVFAQDEGLLGE